MDVEILLLIDTIKDSPVLSEHEKKVFLDTIGRGEPFSEEFFFALGEFINTTLAYEELEEVNLVEKALELREQIAGLQKKLQGDPEKNKAEVRRIIALTNEFLAELKQKESEFEKGVESIVHKSEGDTIDSIRQSLHKPKDQNKS